jgi:hypothetical protein
MPGLRFHTIHRGQSVRDRMASNSGSLGWSECLVRLIWTDA